MEDRKLLLHDNIQCITMLDGCKNGMVGLVLTGPGQWKALATGLGLQNTTSGKVLSPASAPSPWRSPWVISNTAANAALFLGGPGGWMGKEWRGRYVRWLIGCLLDAVVAVWLVLHLWSPGTVGLGYPSAKECWEGLQYNIHMYTVCKHCSGLRECPPLGVKQILILLAVRQSTDTWLFR